ncbi:hypothetical protein [Arthrobacter antioxidans]|uniref:hypothetical protein n=1 Tax=Arthrobacter antioxidans TaxID=2895818 RepID=UPI001FFE8C03|nr:hypothetical protein [Arthrobacter antioxidans]
MKKLLRVAFVVLALTACGAEQLSTNETCSEANAIVTSAGSEGDEDTREAGRQLEDLAEKASDPLKEHLALLADVASANSEGRDEIMNDPERSAEVEDAYTTVSEVCNF